MSYKYYAYDPETGFDTFETEQEAKQAAEDSIDAYRDNAGDGWDETASEVSWGEIKQHSVEIKLDKQFEFEGEMVDSVDYQLQDI